MQCVDRDLGEALGQVFVKKSSRPEVKTDTERMVTQIEEAMEKRINESPWMTPETKKAAVIKLHAMRNKIGYPDHWRDYSALEIRRGEFARQRRARGRLRDRGASSPRSASRSTAASGA